MQCTCISFDLFVAQSCLDLIENSSYRLKLPQIGDKQLLIFQNRYLKHICSSCIVFHLVLGEKTDSYGKEQGTGSS